MAVVKTRWWAQDKKQGHRPELRRLDFNLFRYLLGRILWELDLKRRAVLESWLIFKDYLLQDQGTSILMYQKLNKGSRWPVWWSW